MVLFSPADVSPAGLMFQSYINLEEAIMKIKQAVVRQHLPPRQDLISREVQLPPPAFLLNSEAPPILPPCWSVTSETINRDCIGTAVVLSLSGAGVNQ